MKNHLRNWSYVLLLICLAGFLLGKARANDQDDGKALVGEWKHEDDFDVDMTLDGDGGYKKHHADGTVYKAADWAIKDGKFLYHPLGHLIEDDHAYDYTISPDGDHLVLFEYDASGQVKSKWHYSRKK